MRLQLWLLAEVALLCNRCTLSFRRLPLYVETQAGVSMSTPVPPTQNASLIEVVRQPAPVEIELTTFGSSEASENQASRLRIELLFVRHGHACHNALHYQTAWVRKLGVKLPMGSLTHCDSPDPLLTDCGLMTSTQSGIELNQQLELRDWRADFVGSSSMLRSIETAMATFPGRTVFPLPFISETGDQPCNNPLSVEEQQTVLDGKPVDWRYVAANLSLRDTRIIDGHHHHKNEWGINEARSAVKYAEFRAFLGEQVIPHLLADNAELQRGGGVLRLAIISHSKFLRDKLLKAFDCPTYFVNNAAKMVYYEFDVATNTLRESFGKNGDTCTAILDAPSHRWKEKYLCAKDYARCFSDTSAKRPGWMPNFSGKNPYIRLANEDQKCCV